jgi:ribonuclease P protein component
VQLERIKKRADFLNIAARGKKAVSHGVIVQALEKPQDQTEFAPPLRLGFTVTKKLGNAVVRNRIKRRLKAAAAEIFPTYGKSCVDYVLIGRIGTLTRPYTDLLGDLKYTLRKIEKETSISGGQADA